MLITLACAMSALVPLPTLLRPSRHHELQIRAIAGQQVRVRLRRPLGIVFEEVVPGEAQGVVVADLVENSNAWKDGRVFVGDKLLKCSAVIFGGQSSLVTVGTGSQFTNWERELVPCTKMDFDTIMSAIESNSGRLGYTDVVLVLERTDSSVERAMPAGMRVRLDDDNDDEQWGFAGTNVDGVSTPIRPKPDKF
eukprot:Transcript_6347.p2 GENE.Transcript_6347~~Transcript_6347.p2  ORF type:complete len:194 (-),score=46.52 Transcript_6347:95-676(-)